MSDTLVKMKSSSNIGELIRKNEKGIQELLGTVVLVFMLFAIIILWIVVMFGFRHCYFRSTFMFLALCNECAVRINA